MGSPGEGVGQGENGDRDSRRWRWWQGQTQSWAEGGGGEGWRTEVRKERPGGSATRRSRETRAGPGERNQPGAEGLCPVGKEQRQARAWQAGPSPQQGCLMPGSGPSAQARRVLLQPAPRSPTSQDHPSGPRSGLAQAPWWVSLLWGPGARPQELREKASGASRAEASSLLLSLCRLWDRAGALPGGLREWENGLKARQHPAPHQEAGWATRWELSILTCLMALLGGQPQAFPASDMS